METKYEITWPWLGGFFDGEGCVTRWVQANGLPQPVLSISNNELALLEAIEKFLGEGKGMRIKPSEGGRSYFIQITGAKRILPILKKLYSHLQSEDTKDRARYCLELCQRMKDRTGYIPGEGNRLPDEERAYRIWLAEQSMSRAPGAQKRRENYAKQGKSIS